MSGWGSFQVSPRLGDGTSFEAGMPVLRPLAGFKRPMQIVWLGQVRNLGRAGQLRPQIEVVLRPAEDPAAPTLRRLVPAAFVRAMRLGDVWHGPNLVATSSASLIQLKGLQISGEAAHVSPIGKPLEGAHGEYPLDFRSFSDHSGHTGAYAVRERLADGRLMVVPCWELLRFYFGASGALVSRLLSGPIIARALYKSIRHDKRSDTHWLDLAPGLHVSAAATVARIALDNRAASAARWISNSGVAANINRQAYYPKTNFPFQGKTDLTVQGHWFDQGSQSVLFVERIVSCSFPFPFRNLHYSVLPKTGISMRSRMRSGSSLTRAPTDFRPEVREAPLLTKDSVAMIYLPEDADVAFPDLLGKVFKRVRPRAENIQTSRPGKQDIGKVFADGSDVASEEGFPQVELASQDEAREDEVIAPEAIDVLRSAVEILRGEKFNVSLQSLGDTSVEELMPLQNILPGVEQLGKAFSCIGLRRGGGRTRSAAYCLVRTRDDGLPIETAMLLYAPPQKMDAHRAISQAFDILQRGQQGGVGVASAPEFVANNPYAVARLIRQLTW